jgi:hypothetical protein
MADIPRTGAVLRTDAWIDQQKTALTTQEEKAVLSEINAVYDGYLAAASEIAAGAASLDKFKVEADEERLISLGLKLANAHREALGRFAASTLLACTAPSRHLHHAAGTGNVPGRRPPSFTAK